MTPPNGSKLEAEAREAAKEKFPSHYNVGFELVHDECGRKDFIDGYLAAHRKLPPEIVLDPRTSSQHSAAQKDPDRWMTNHCQQTPAPVATQDQHATDPGESIFQKIQDDLQKEVNSLQKSQRVVVSLAPETSVQVELQSDGSALLYLTVLEPLPHKEDASAAIRQAQSSPKRKLKGLDQLLVEPQRQDLTDYQRNVPLGPSRKGTSQP